MSEAKRIRDLLDTLSRGFAFEERQSKIAITETGRQMSRWRDLLEDDETVSTSEPAAVDTASSEPATVDTAASSEPATTSEPAAAAEPATTTDTTASDTTVSTTPTASEPTYPTASDPVNNPASSTATNPNSLTPAFSPAGATPAMGHYDTASSKVGMDANGAKQFANSQPDGTGFHKGVWCADFANATLAKNGVPGSGSSLAKSFLNVGSPVEAGQAQKGDIAVLNRGDPASGKGHVGFVQSVNPNGTVSVLGGNQGGGAGKVTVQNFPASQVVGYRRIQ